MCCTGKKSTLLRISNTALWGGWVGWGFSVGAASVVTRVLAGVGAAMLQEFASRELSVAVTLTQNSRNLGQNASVLGKRRIRRYAVSTKIFGFDTLNKKTR